MTRVLDRTLATGAAGGHNADQVAAIGVLLAGLGVDAVECGPGPQAGAVVKAVGGLPVVVAGVTDPATVAAAAESGAAWVAFAVTGAPAERLVAEARRHGLLVRLDIGGDRPDPWPDRPADADRLCLTDASGVLDPAETADLVRRLRARYPGTAVEVRAGDGRGLGVANALAALDSGADWVSAAVWDGETADLAKLLDNLWHRGDRERPPDELLAELRRWARVYRRPVPPDPMDLVVRPQVISATELRHHRSGPGQRFVLVDDRFVPGAGQYCIARRIPELADYGAGHVDTHVHDCDSLFVFLGAQDHYQGLRVEVTLADRVFPLDSPASVFIPAGVPHGYRVLAGAGTYLNHVLAGSYNASLLDPPELRP